MARVLGVAGAGERRAVEDAGAVTNGDVRLDWWVGADDRWHVPAEEVATRTRRLGPAPVYETVVRIPGGEAVRRVYAAAGPGDPVVVEVENASPAPFALAHVVSAGDGRRRTTVHVDERGLVRDDRLLVAMPRVPLRWATAVGGSAREVVMSGAARDGAFEVVSGTAVEAVVLLPVAHRTTARVALLASEAGAPDVRTLPGPAEVASGWDALLDRGLRTELPDPLQPAVDDARADLLLAPATADVAVALEDWGFDREFHDAWGRLGWRARRRAARRDGAHASWPDVKRALACGDPVELLRSVRDVLVGDGGETVAVLPGFPPEWLGANLAVHEVPLRAGPCSFAVRWHGPRPALLWDAPAGVTLRAPALDPSWTGAGGAGEHLLAAPPAPLLAMGTPEQRGEPLEEPETFT